jgi:hypothetical protein
MTPEDDNVHAFEVDDGVRGHDCILHRDLKVTSSMRMEIYKSLSSFASFGTTS